MLRRRRRCLRPLWIWEGVGDEIDVDRVGKKRVASLRSVRPGAVELVMAQRKSQVKVWMCV